MAALAFLAAASVLCSSLTIHAQQQTYPHAYNIDSVDCQTRRPENAGYLCSQAQTRCQTFAYYVVSSYLLSSKSPAAITSLSDLASKLFSTNASAIAAASNISQPGGRLTPGQALFIPLDCQCAGKYSIHNVTYTIQPGDLFYKLVNFTYEGLITCQAIMDANPTVMATDLQINSNCTFPVRCACPNQEQIDKGFQMLVTYPVQTGDDFSSIASMFGVLDQDLLAANNLTSINQAIFPSTSVLVPLREKPTAPPLKASVSVSPSSSSHTGRSTSHTGRSIGIGIAIAVVVVLLAVAAFIFFKRKKPHSKTEYAEAGPKASQTDGANLHRPLFDPMDFISSEKVHCYTMQEVKDATQDFSPSHHIKGSVYRGVLAGRVVAVKKVIRNVSQELQILQKVHHASLVAILGYCMTGPEQSYLVYEYAENGSLSDWLHGESKTDSSSSTSSSFLSWNKRLQIALDVATGLQYIHDYATPSFMHKDVKSSNILLDANFRGKVANFALAKIAESRQQQAALTKHIVGTQGYLAPEYVDHGVVSPKLDVFAFGVVLLEMLSGEEAIMRDQEGMLVAGREGFLSESIGHVLQGNDAKEKLKSWMDPVLRNAYPLDCAYQLAQVAQDCVAEDLKSRPSMRDLVFVLSKMVEVSLEWEPSGTLEKTYADNPLEGR